MSNKPTIPALFETEVSNTLTDVDGNDYRTALLSFPPAATIATNLVLNDSYLMVTWAIGNPRNVRRVKAWRVADLGGNLWQFYGWVNPDALAFLSGPTTRRGNQLTQGDKDSLIATGLRAHGSGVIPRAVLAGSKADILIAIEHDELPEDDE